MCKKNVRNGGGKMSIKKLLNKGDESKKIVSKNFRLRPQAMRALEYMTEKTEVSQNESINVILEDTFEDFKALETVKILLDKHKEVSMYKLFPKKRYFKLDLKQSDENELIACNLKLYKQDFPFGAIDELHLDLDFTIKEVQEILDIGFDSSFVIIGGGTIKI